MNTNERAINQFFRVLFELNIFFWWASALIQFLLIWGKEE